MCVCVSVWGMWEEGEGGTNNTLLSNPPPCLLSTFPLAPLLLKGVAPTSCLKQRYATANTPLPCPHMGALHITVRRVKCHWSGSARINSWSGSLPRKIRTRLSLLSVSLRNHTHQTGGHGACSSVHENSQVGIQTVRTPSSGIGRSL